MDKKGKMLSEITNRSQNGYASKEWLTNKLSLKKTPSLHYDLQSDPEVRSHLLDGSYAAKLYSSLTCREYEHKETGTIWGASSRWIGDFIAMSRPFNEDYLDFYGQCTEGCLYKDVLEDIYRLGWEVASTVEQDLDEIRDLISLINRP